MALPRFDAGVWLRAAVEPAFVALFHETDSRGTAEGISQIAGVFAARSIHGSSPAIAHPTLTSILSLRERKKREHLPLRDTDTSNLIAQGFGFQFCPL